jgi:hypothetical protein
MRSGLSRFEPSPVVLSRRRLALSPGSWLPLIAERWHQSPAPFSLPSRGRISKQVRLQEESMKKEHACQHRRQTELLESSPPHIGKEVRRIR